MIIFCLGDVDGSFYFVFDTKWDDNPPDGEDEDLILLKYWRQEYNYVFYKEIIEGKYYRQRSFVSFERELIINVSV